MDDPDLTRGPDSTNNAAKESRVKLAPATIDRKRHDQNRTQTLTAVQALQRLLKVAEDPAFTGSAVVEVHAKAGAIGAVKTQLTEFLDRR